MLTATARRGIDEGAAGATATVANRSARQRGMVEAHTNAPQGVAQLSLAFGSGVFQAPVDLAMLPAVDRSMMTPPPDLSVAGDDLLQPQPSDMGAGTGDDAATLPHDGREASGCSVAGTARTSSGGIALLVLAAAALLSRRRNQRPHRSVMQCQ